MTYLIMQILACLIVATVIGFILGWVARGARKPRDETHLLR